MQPSWQPHFIEAIYRLPICVLISPSVVGSKLRSNHFVLIDAQLAVLSGDDEHEVQNDRIRVKLACHQANKRRQAVQVRETGAFNRRHNS